MFRGFVLYQRLRHCTQGSVAVIGALSIIAMVGMGAFAVEASAGYAAKVTNQRVADMAALAGALAYNVANDTTAMTATAKAVVIAQGLSASAADIALTSDSGTGKQLVQVTITTTVPLALARVLTSDTGYNVVSSGFATINAQTTTAPPCIAGLSGSLTYGVNLNGGVSISAPGCAINTNSGVDVPNGTSIAAKEVNAGKTVHNPGNITTSPTAGKVNQNKANAASDWMSDDANLKAVLCKVNRLTGASDSDYADGNRSCSSPLVTPTPLSTTNAANWDLNYNPASNVAAYRTGNSSYVIPAGSYTIGTLTLGGGITATFQGPTTLMINQVSMGGGTTLTIGDGSVTIVGALNLAGGNAVTIGNGAHNFGSISVGGGGDVVVGSGNLNIVGELDVSGGGSTATFAIGSGESVVIGATSGTAINLSGGSYLSFVPAGQSPVTAGFSANGDISTKGGSTIIFNKAATHAINGNLDLSGGSTFGSGTYVIKGDFTNNTGGTMSGVDVTFALGGTFTLSGGTSLDLAAPSSTSAFGVPNLLVATKSTAATKIGGGSSDRYSGLIYAPDSDMSLSGGASISTQSSACLMLIVNSLTLSGGGTLSTGSCTGLTGASSSTASVALFK
jgi:Flp pilus assembly protein TadG